MLIWKSMGTKFQVVHALATLMASGIRKTLRNGFPSFRFLLSNYGSFGILIYSNTKVMALNTEERNASFSLFLLLV